MAPASGAQSHHRAQGSAEAARIGGRGLSKRDLAGGGSTPAGGGDTWTPVWTWAGMRGLLGKDIVDAAIVELTNAYSRRDNELDLNVSASLGVDGR